MEEVSIPVEVISIYALLVWNKGDSPPIFRLLHLTKYMQTNSPPVLYYLAFLDFHKGAEWAETSMFGSELATS
jgi:hypothetical protein